jgi:hypothetical protein
MRRSDWDVVDYLRVRSALQLYLYWLLVFGLIFCSVSVRSEKINDKGMEVGYFKIKKKKRLISVIKPAGREHFGNLDVNMRIILK